MSNHLASQPDTARAGADSENLETLAALVSTMAKVGSCSSPSFSPDGSRIAFVSNLSGVQQVWTVGSEGGWPQRVTALDETISTVEWSPDGEWLAFTLAPGGGMNTQIYIIRPDGTGLRRLTPGGRDNNRLGPWSYDGKSLFVASSLRTPEAIDAYRVNLPEGKMELLAENPGVGFVSGVSRDARRAVVNRMVNRGNNNLYLLDIETQTETLLTAHDGPGSFGGGRFSPDGRQIYLSSNKDREMLAFARIELDPSGKPGALAVLAGRDDAELDNFDLSEDGRTAVLVWNKAGKSEITFLDLEKGTQSSGPRIEAEVVHAVSLSRDGNLLAVGASGAAMPQNIWVYDRRAGNGQELRRITDSPHAGLKLGELVRPELVRFPGHDGLELSAWLYLPLEGSRPYPLVMNYHGGPEAQERPLFNSLFQTLLAQGIAVLAPNVRGSTGFGKTFVNLDNGALRVNAVRDIKACLDYVVGQGLTLKNTVGIMGGSYGGYMTMAGLTEYPESFAAGANQYGIVNFETFFAHTEPWMAAVSKVEYGDPETEPEMLRSLSPIHRIDQVKAPTIVLHGANDTNVPVIEAEQVVESLKARGVPVEYVLFPDEGHGFLKTSNKTRAIMAITRWFTRYLKQ